MAGEGLLDDPGVDDPGGAERRCPCPGERGVDLAAVLRRAVPLDPASIDEAVDDAGEPTGGDPQAGSEVEHPQPLPRGCAEPGQKVVLDQ